MSVEDDRAFLNSISAHSGRPGDTSNLHPDLVVRLAAAIRQARSEGIPATLFSGYRGDTETGSAYDRAGYSSHGYGLASDVGGLGGYGSKNSQRWNEIAAANGLTNPYWNSPRQSQAIAEYNHYQLNPQPLEKTPQLLASLQAARATGDYSKVWSGYTPTVAGTMAQAAASQPLVSLAAFKSALAGNESAGWSNPYMAEGPRVISKDGVDRGRAVGKYQVMPENIPGWTKQYLGTQMTREQFIGNKDAQEKLMDAWARDNIAKYGLRGAVNLWFTGKPNPPASANDKYMTAPAYLTKFQQSYDAALGGKTASGDDAITPGTSAAGAPAASGTSSSTEAPASNTPIPPLMDTPEMTMGRSLANIGMSMGSGGGSQLVGHDDPAIRMPALEAQGAPTPSAQPLEYQQGHSALAAQLGALSGQPTPMTNALGEDSITAGAPSMTAMLGMVGTPAEFNWNDARRTTSPTLKAPLTRLG